jgi:hypothetical protein
MDPFFFVIIAISLGIPLIAKLVLHHSICWKEWLLQTGILAVILSGVFFMAQAGQTSDMHIANGQIVDKYKDRVSCSHSYQCRCSTDSKGHKTCSTCYRHSFDYDWVLETSVGNIIIDRVNSQGTIEPKRFTQAQIGSPVALGKSWTNYVKASPHSLFHTTTDLDVYAQSVPEYPATISDYHYNTQRVMTIGKAMQSENMEIWNNDLAHQLKKVGQDVAGNIILIFTDIPSPAFSSAIENKWLRGKYNDTVVVVGVEEDKIMWANAFGWGKNPLLYITLRDEIMALKTVDRDSMMTTVSQTVITHYAPLEKDHFKYLKSDIRLPLWGYLALLLLSGFLSFATTLYFHRNQTF